MVQDFNYGRLWSRKSGLVERQIVVADYYLDRYNNKTGTFEPGVLPYSINDVIIQKPNKDGLYEVAFDHPLDYTLSKRTVSRQGIKSFDMHMDVLDDTKPRQSVLSFIPHNLYGPSSLQVTGNLEAEETVFPYFYAPSYRIYGQVSNPQTLRLIHSFAKTANITVPLSAFLIEGLNINVEIEPTDYVKEIIVFFQKIYKDNIFNVSENIWALPRVKEKEIHNYFHLNFVETHEYATPAVKEHFRRTRRHLNYSFPKYFRHWVLDEMQAIKINKVFY